MLAEPLRVVARIAAVFDDLGVRYLIGGSLASSLQGIPRATQDVDVVAELGLAHVENFAESLREDFYLDTESMRAAIRERGSFNVIHLPTMFKADVFVAGGDPWQRVEFDRARVETVESETGPATVRFASAEDVLHKLVWYRAGGEVSERQWHDVLGVLKVQSAALDDGYLEMWSRHLGVDDLLRRARKAPA